MFTSALAGTYLWYILQGFWVTLELSALALALGSILGFAGGALRTSSCRRLSAAMAGYVAIFRSVPVVIQLFLVFYGTPILTGIDLPPFAAATGTLAAYFAAYMTEIVRAGIEALPRGQTDAAHALGLGYFQTMRYIILPQALRVITPGWVGLILSGVKDSSLASIIGVTELTSASLTVRSNTYTNWDVFGVLTGSYFVLCSVISYAGSHLEKRLRIVERTSAGTDLSGRAA
jgi:polar amino acid transport system permease protein